jgi:hypothetical protein
MKQTQAGCRGQPYRKKTIFLRIPEKQAGWKHLVRRGNMSFRGLLPLFLGGALAAALLLYIFTPETPFWEQRRQGGPIQKLYGKRPF